MRLFLCLLVLSSQLKVAQAASTLINGAGATFPYPLYSKWFSEYQKVDESVKINYQSIGSGGGIRQLLEKTIDFGASDAPMSDEQLAKSPVAILHIPTALGAVVVTYNLASAPKDLRMSGEVIARIFLGKITRWNDAQIQALNVGATLPAQDILVVHRSDGSGTTNIFTDYLSQVSSDWKSKAGTGTAINWPVGLGGKGNEGVAGLVKQSPGSIGYVELVYAQNNKLSFATLQNKSKSFVVASPESISFAAAQASKSIPADFRASIVNADGTGSYPISGFTYLLIYETMPEVTAKKLSAFLKWAITDGQKLCKDLGYAPLPTNLVPKILAAVARVRPK